jgi:hypothetical protein
MAGRVFSGTNLAPLAKDIDSWLRGIVKKQNQSLPTLWRRKLSVLIAQLAAGTPAYTGAAAGTQRNAKVDEIPKWHPAYGMTIGNDPGDSGWQLETVQTDKGTTFYIMNPMWLKYLVYVNAIGSNAGFVDQIWEQFKRDQGF